MNIAEGAGHVDIRMGLCRKTVQLKTDSPMQSHYVFIAVERISTTAVQG